MQEKPIRENKAFRSVLFVLLMSLACLGHANPVDMSTVREVAVKFVNANAKVPLQDAEDLQFVTTYRTEHDDAAFHIFNTPKGFVIVSADDCATPILGYSDEGRPFDLDDIPIQLQGYLHDFVEQIGYSIDNHLEADENTARQWELVRTMGRLNDKRDGEVVEPLITALWSQRCYYNAMCPEDPDGPCDHVLTGCVATAMGMILHYWGYPEHGTGSHTYTPLPYPTTQYPEQSVNFGETTYDWMNMPNQLTDTSTQAEIDAVSTLLWHCGVAVDMNYSPYGSGMEGHFSALIDYFDYSDDMHWESRQDDESWKALLKADLDFGRPIFYTGHRSVNSGHAFVCDGYDVNDRFHFNWGWGGSANGYFALDATMTFVYTNEAIFNIHPNDSTSLQHPANFTQGWNWFSLFVEMNPTEALAMLEEGLGGNALLIKSRNGGYVEYDDEEEAWFGTLTQLTNEDMYMIQSTTACTVELEGSPANPSSHAITINPGWNWIGFPCNEEVSVMDAFASFAAEEDDRLKSREAYTEFDGEEWFGGLSTLVPGQGYMYYSNGTVPKSLIFQTGAKTRQ